MVVSLKMMTKVKIDHAAMTAEVGRIGGEALLRGAEISRQRMVRNIVDAGLVDTGAMRDSVQIKPVQGPPTRQSVLVGSPLPQATYTEYGTRAHGPVTAKVLRFKPKGSGRYVFARWVRGIKPYKWAQRTLDQVRPSDFEGGGM